MAKKKTVILLYGEKTKQLNVRVPESKYSIIRDEINGLLKKYESPNQATSETDKREFSKKPIELVPQTVIPERIATTDYIEKKSNPTDSDIETAVAEIKKDKIKALQAMADTIKNGGGVKSELFAKKKINIDEEYEFEVVKTLPDINDQIHVDKNGIAMYDKYDIGVFYIKWEGRYLKFVNSVEFNRFLKDNQIK